MVLVGNASVKQQPVIQRLHLLMLDAIAVSAAIRDNAQDDGEYLPDDLVLSFSNDYETIISNLNEASRNAPWLKSLGNN
jgi:hypothetical protein